MAAAAAIGFVVEMVNAVLHGLQRKGLAMRINGAGLATGAALGLPATAVIGLAGSGLGMLAANLARAVMAARTISGLVARAKDVHG